MNDEIKTNFHRRKLDKPKQEEELQLPIKVAKPEKKAPGLFSKFAQKLRSTNLEVVYLVVKIISMITVAFAILFYLVIMPISKDRELKNCIKTKVKTVADFNRCIDLYK